VGRARSLGKFEVVAGVGAVLLLASVVAVTGPSTAGAGPTPPTFSDVGPSHPFVEEIEWVATEGITEGYADGTFRPSLPVTRQAMAAFLHRFSGSPEGPFADPGFSDVVAPHPFGDEIAWAAAEGITTGFEDGSFRPGAPVTRQSAAAFLHRLEGEPAPDDAPSFSDVSVEHPFHTEISWLAGAGITTGYDDGTFRPGAVVTRQSAAAFLFRLDQLPDPPDPEVGVALGNPDSRLGSDPINGSGPENVWLSVGSRAAQKQSGDRYTNGACNLGAAGLVTGCSGTGADLNLEYAPHGHLYRVSVGPLPPGQPLRIQVYDPAWTSQGDLCGSNNMTPTQITALVASGETTMDDGASRYAADASPYCTGDQALNGDMAATSYIVRGPDDTPEDALDNPVISGCVRTFSGRSISATEIYDRLRQSTAYDSPAERGFEGLGFRQHFRQWFTLCTISSVEEGDYVVQVRSNPDTSDLPNSAVNADPAANPGGQNRFSLRAGFGSSGVPSGTGVQVQPTGHLVSTINGAESPATTYVARVDESHAGETLGFELFDLGDTAGGTVSFEVVPPPDANVGASFAGCTAVRDGTPNLSPTMTGCGISAMTSAVYNGRTVALQIPIPADYDCDEADEHGCWLRLVVSYANGATPNETFTLTNG
jgi:hypothetical protein